MSDLHKPVHVREYRRIRLGIVEKVREHPRRARRWGKRPKFNPLS